MSVEIFEVGDVLSIVLIDPRFDLTMIKARVKTIVCYDYSGQDPRYYLDWNGASIFDISDNDYELSDQDNFYCNVDEWQLWIQNKNNNMSVAVRIEIEKL
jgi:hypothetical protein